MAVNLELLGTAYVCILSNQLSYMGLMFFSFFSCKFILCTGCSALCAVNPNHKKWTRNKNHCLVLTYIGAAQEELESEIKNQNLFFNK